MRKDMAKILVERPRVGGNGGNSNEPKGYKKKLERALRNDGESLDSFESTSRHRKYGWDAKEFNENLAPLHRFLHTKIGCHWNEVWSEICENLRVDSVVQSHVRDHVGFDVELNVVMINGEPYQATRDGKIYSRFYVNPDTGILCENTQRKYHYRNRKQLPQFVPGKDEWHQYRLIDNIWYEIKLAPLPETKMFPDRYDRLNYDCRWMNTVKDVLLTRSRFYGFGASHTDCRRTYGNNVYAVNKRQLNSREIKKLKLWETEVGINAKKTK